MSGLPQKIKRLSFPEDEQRHTWLGLLLSGYAIFDLGVETAVKREEERSKKLACREGCSSCCTTHADIPLYPLERKGIDWFVIEKLLDPYRKDLRKRLKTAANNKTCPFLAGGSCIIHIVRPAACRQFNVFGKPCAEGEDAYHSRRQDVLTPLKEYADAAFMTMMPYYGIVDLKAKQRAVRDGLLHASAISMKKADWEELVKLMDEFGRAVQK